MENRINQIFVLIGDVQYPLARVGKKYFDSLKEPFDGVRGVPRYIYIKKNHIPLPLVFSILPLPITDFILRFDYDDQLWFTSTNNRQNFNKFDKNQIPYYAVSDE